MSSLRFPGDTLSLTGGTITGTTTISGASFGLSGNISAVNWATNGVQYKNVPATLTNTTSSGTVATAYSSVWGGNTIAASAATTFTNYYEAYFTAPIQGTNVTMTNSWALGADSLQVNGPINLTGGVTAGAASSFSGVTTFTNTMKIQGGNGANRGVSIGVLGIADITMGSDIVAAWTSSTNPNGTKDTGLSRDTAGVIDVGTGAQGSKAGSMNMTNLSLLGTLTYASSTTGAGTQTFTNSPCTGLTTERWIPVQITGQTGTWYIPTCQ